MENWLSKLFKMYNRPSSADKKQAMLDLLAEENEQVLGLAYMYAKNMHLYGADVTKEWNSAVQQSVALYDAYIQGRTDSDKEWRERLNRTTI